MSISFALAIYFVLWWVVLFAVLPIGVRNRYEVASDEVAGADPGAPVVPRLGLKVLLTTLIALVIQLIGIAAWRAGYLNVAWLTSLIGMPY